MKKIINILFLLVHLVYALELNDKFWQFNDDGSGLLLNRVNTNHYFSIMSSSANGSFDSYGMYGNFTSFSLNNRTQLFTNFNLSQPMSAGHYSSDKLDYSMSIGLNYQLTENTLFSFEIATAKYANPFSINRYNSYLP